MIELMEKYHDITLTVLHIHPIPFAFQSDLSNTLSTLLNTDIYFFIITLNVFLLVSTARRSGQSFAVAQIWKSFSVQAVIGDFWNTPRRARWRNPSTAVQFALLFSSGVKVYSRLMEINNYNVLPS